MTIIEQLHNFELLDTPSLKKLIDWAALHISDQSEVIDNLRLECKEYQTMIDIQHKKMASLKLVLNDSLSLIDLPIFEFETGVKDLSSFINIMAANGIEPYTKRVKGWQDKKAKVFVMQLPQLEFQMEQK